MSKRCSYVHPNGKPCRRFPLRGNPFCYNHKPRPELLAAENPRQHPLERLTTLQDVFLLVRDALNGVRTGRMAPARAAAITKLVYAWLRVMRRMDEDDHVDALYHQIVPAFTDFEVAAKEARDDDDLEDEEEEDEEEDNEQAENEEVAESADDDAAASNSADKFAKPAAQQTPPPRKPHRVEPGAADPPKKKVVM